MANKTFKVETFRKQINEQLASDKLSQDAKSALATTLEGILHSTGNYHGYSYNDVPLAPLGKDFDNSFLYTDDWRNNHEYNRYYFS